MRTGGCEETGVSTDGEGPRDGVGRRRRGLRTGGGERKSKWHKVSTQRKGGQRKRVMKQRAAKDVRTQGGARTVMGRGGVGRGKNAKTKAGAGQHHENVGRGGQAGRRMRTKTLGGAGRSVNTRAERGHTRASREHTMTSRSSDITPGT